MSERQQVRDKLGLVKTFGATVKVELTAAQVKALDAHIAADQGGGTRKLTRAMVLTDALRDYLPGLRPERTNWAKTPGASGKVDGYDG